MYQHESDFALLTMRRTGGSAGNGECCPAPAAPTVEPGQIWLIEQPSSQALFPLDLNALSAANVVMYDRPLAPMVARVLPIGTYAEPLPLGESAAGSAISPRALQFAAEGWSVVQLVEPRPGWRARMREAAAALHTCDHGAAGLPVAVVAKTQTDQYRTSEAELSELAGLIDEFGEDDRLTLVFGPLAVSYPAASHLATANGLAG